MDTFWNFCQVNFVKRTIPQFFVDIAFFGVRRSTLVGQRPIKSLSSVRRLSVRPLLSFLKIGSGEFDCRSQIFFWGGGGNGDRMSPTSLNQAQNDIFRHFIEFGWYVFVEIEYDDSLRQCQICIGGGGGVKFGPNGPKSGSKLGFSPFSQVWLISFPLNCIGW